MTKTTGLDRSVPSLLLDAVYAASNTKAASRTNEAVEMHNRIEVWVNEGGGGGEAN